MSINKMDLSLHCLFKNMYRNIRSRKDSLISFGKILKSLNIANEDTNKNYILLCDPNDPDIRFSLSCNSSTDKRSNNFIDTKDDISTRKRTESDQIREILYTYFCKDNFNIVSNIAKYFSNEYSNLSRIEEFIKEFCNNSCDNDENKVELKKHILGLDDVYLKIAWVFVFLCFPKNPSEKNTDFRSQLIIKLLKEEQISIGFHPLDITYKESQIEKINTDHIGRDAELKEIRTEMLNNNTVILYGIGGIGKSYICRKLYWNYHYTYSDGIEYIAWIQYNGDLMQSIISSFYETETDFDNISEKYLNHPIISEFYKKISLTDKLEEKLQIVKTCFNKLDKRLLVFIDNADTLTKEEKKWLNSCTCRMIITSRQKIDSFYNVHINNPSHEYCREMYVREINENSNDTYSLNDRKYIDKIIELANYHTITVMLISKAQITLGLSFREMYEELINRGFVLKGLNEVIDTENYELTMAEHLTKIFNLLSIEDETQLRTIRLFSLLAPNTKINKKDIQKWFELNNLTSINKLVKYGWLISSGSEFVSIHPVVADVVKYNYKPDFAFCLPLINALETEMKIAENYIMWNKLIVHAISVAKAYDNIENGRIVSFYVIIAFVYHGLGKLEEELEYYNKALTISEKVFGSEHFYIASFLDRMGLVYDNLGEYEKSLNCLKKSLIIREKVFGTEHPNTARSYNNIGCIYNCMSEYFKALEYHKKALAIREKIFGTEHPDTAFSYTNIGSVYDNQGNYYEAIELYKKALEISKNILGNEHPWTATVYNNISEVFYSIGDYNKALEYMKKGLTIKEIVIGTEHPLTALSYNNIGIFYNSMGEYGKSLKYLKKALIIREKAFGTDCPLIATSYNNIGSVYDNTGEYDKALEYYKQALSIYEKVFGKDNPYTAAGYNNIGSVYSKLREYVTALEYFNKALVIEKKEGPKHPYIASIYSNFGVVYNSLGEYNKAIEYFKKALEVYENVFGTEHPYTKAILEQINDIFNIIQKQKRRSFL